MKQIVAVLEGDFPISAIDSSTQDSGHSDVTNCDKIEYSIALQLVHAGANFLY